MKFEKAFQKLIYVYITLPIIIFFLGWLKPVIGIPCACLVIAGLALIFVKKESTDFTYLFKKENVETWVKIILVIVVWVVLSGIGKFSYQNTDHKYRNQIFDLLVNNAWPVVKQYDLGLRQLNYYIGFWLPSAVFGKVFGVNAGYIFQMVWTELGIFIFMYLFATLKKSVKTWYILLFIFFSGLDVLGARLLNTFDTEKLSIFAMQHLEWWNEPLQFSSFTTQLFWVFNQAMPAWITLMLLLNQKDNRRIAFIMGASLICSPFQFIGMIPFVIYKLIVCIPPKSVGKNRLKIALLEIFTFENIICGGLMGIITFLYFKSNSAL